MISVKPLIIAPCLNLAIVLIWLLIRFLNGSEAQEEADRIKEEQDREVMALSELVDASLLEFSEEYAPLSPIQEPKWRVKTLLMKLESDRKNSTDYFSDKFVAKVSEIFSGLPKPKDHQSFAIHDLPLLFTASEVQQFALDHKLNKAQTKAVNELHKADPSIPTCPSLIPTLLKSVSDKDQAIISKQRCG